MYHTEPKTVKKMYRTGTTTGTVFWLNLGEENQGDYHYVTRYPISLAFATQASLVLKLSEEAATIFPSAEIFLQWNWPWLSL
jgi:hypothetical protein